MVKGGILAATTSAGQESDVTRLSGVVTGADSVTIGDADIGVSGPNHGLRAEPDSLGRSDRGLGGATQHPPRAQDAGGSSPVISQRIRETGIMPDALRSSMKRVSEKRWRSRHWRAARSDSIWALPER